MAIRGVNLSEKEPFIHPDDPGHPDNINHIINQREAAEIKKGARKTAYDANKRAEMYAEIEKDDPPTVYHIGNLTTADRIELGDMGATPTMRDGGITMSLRNTMRTYEVVKRGLKGWENQLDHKGDQAKFVEGTLSTADGSFQKCVDDTSMVHLPQQVLMELSNKILEKNGMTAVLEKKSEGASPLSAELSSVIGDAPTAPTPSEPNEDAPNQPNEK